MKNKLAKNSLALGLTTMLVTAGLSFSAQGADPTQSYAAARFLSGSLGSTNLDNIVQLHGTKATNPGDPGANVNPLTLDVLNAITVDVPGGVPLNIAGVLSPTEGSAGVANHFAQAASPSSAAGASGAVSDTGAILTGGSQFPSNAKISLSDGLLDAVNDAIASVDLEVGALSSSTVLENQDLQRDYQIAGANLQIGVPILEEIVPDLEELVSPISDLDEVDISIADVCDLTTNAVPLAADALLGILTGSGEGGIAELLTRLLGLGTNEVNVCEELAGLLDNVAIVGAVDALLDLKIKVTGLGGLVDGIGELTGQGIVVDLAAGTLTLDLEALLAKAGLNINTLPPNTDIIAALVADGLLGSVTDLLGDTVDTVLDRVGDLGVQILLGPAEVVSLQLSEITGAVAAVGPALAGVTDALEGALEPVDQVIGQIVDSLGNIVRLTANNQTTSSTPTIAPDAIDASGEYFRTSALKLDVLSGNFASVDLAASEAAVVAAPAADDADADAAADADAPADADTAADADTDTDGDGDADTGSDAESDVDADADTGTDAVADADANGDAVADADAAADADVTQALPDAGASRNLLPFMLLGLALALFGAGVLLNEKRQVTAP